ncbi:MAG: amino acid adenylation domain-containing protein [Burkholderiales bacterium]|nr:amino acid adenylation domain-containing protein [Burkholderiales bacterium]
MTQQPPYLIDLIEHSAQQYADAIALQFEQNQLHYQQLNAAANTLARQLQMQGVGPETVVALLFERSFEMVIALLAVLKTGAIYLPLGIELPLARLQDQLEDSHPQCLLYHAPTQQKAMQLATAHRINIDTKQLLAESTANASPNPQRQLHAEQGVNLIFTSGSTGKPKGVLNTQAGLKNRIIWMQNTYQLTPNDVVLQKTPYTFDVAGWEFLWPLAIGATLCIAKPEGHKDPGYLADLIHKAGISVLHFVPSMLFAFLTEDNLAQRCASLRMLFTSGEALPPAVLQQAQRSLTCAIHNLYGPTEAAIDITAWTAPDGWQGNVPIGRPISGCACLILDEQMQMVAPGDTGELFLTGVGLARGYFNSAHLTAEKFIPHPFPEIHGLAPGARMYRSGDLARINQDGEIEYLGRIDTQIKLRGQRLELSEIENALEACADVQRAAVCALPDAHGLRLVACVQAKTDHATPDDDSLRQQLARYLPEYMLPQHILWLADLPLSSNGKLARGQLQEMARQTFLHTPAGNVANIASAEQGLRAIWCHILSRAQAHENDDFFACGGDSIQVLLLVASARKAGLPLTATEIYQHKRLGALEALLAQKQGKAETRTDWSQRPQQALALTPIQHWFFQHAPQGLAHWNQSFLLHSTEKLDPSLLQQAFTQLLARHDVFALRFSHQAGQWQASYSLAQNEGVFSVLPRASDADLAQQCLAIQQSLQPEEGKLAALALLQGADESRGDMLLMVVHHLVVDGISWRVLLPELELRYRALQNGGTAPLGPVPTSYGNWALNLQQAAAKELHSDLALWQSLQQEAAYSHLPQDGGTGGNLGHDLQIQRVSVSHADSDLILQHLPHFYQVNINELLLTALAHSLQQATGHSHNRIWLEGHGREDLAANMDISQTVGWFTTIFPLTLHAKPQLLHSLLETRKRYRQLPRKGFSWSALHYLQQALPAVAADVTFNYLGQFDSLFAQGGLFTPSLQARGVERAPHAPRFEHLYIEGMHIGAQLHFDWHYSVGQHSAAQIKQWSDAFVHALHALIAHYRQHANTPWLAHVIETERVQLQALYPQAYQVAPLLPLQRGLLFDTELANDDNTYCVAVSLQLVGPLQPMLLQQCWREVEAAHDILHSRCAKLNTALSPNETPLQVFVRGATCPFTISTEGTALAAVPPLSYRFAPHEATPMAWHLQRLASTDERWLLQWSHHHALLDGSSVRLVLDELLQRYQHKIAQQPIALATCSPSVPSFASLIHSLQEPELAARLYWQQQLANIEEVPALPHCYALPAQKSDATPSTAFAELRQTITPALRQQMQQAAQRMSVTSNSLFFAAMALMLAKLSNSSEALFFTTHSLRPAEQPEFARTVGLCLNTLPLRIALSASDSPSQFCGKVQQTLLAAQQHGTLGLSEILSSHALLREGFAQQACLLNIEAYQQQVAAQYGDLQVQDLLSLERTTYPLTLNVALEGEHITLSLLYNQALYPTAEASNLLSCFVQALQALSAPSVDAGADVSADTLGAINLLPAAEQTALLRLGRVGVNRAELPSIATLWAQQLAQHGQRTALVYQGQRYSYQQLQAWSEQIAHRLQTHGVEAGSTVAILARRCPEFVALILACVKLGACYVPIDAQYHKERRSFILHDAKTQVLVAPDEELAKGDWYPSTLATLSFSTLQFTAEASLTSSASQQPQFAAAHPVYMMYTSGSTGQPKGVAIPQQAIVRLVHETDYCQLDSSRRMLHLASVAFDASTFEIWGALLNGGSLHIAPDEKNSLADIAQFIRQQEISTAFLTTALFVQLVEFEVDALSQMRDLLVGGETIPVPAFCKLLQQAPHLRLANVYGPTENTTFSTYRRFTQQDLPWLAQAQALPLGGPIRDCEALILDQNHQLLSAGVAGLLYLGGPGLALGYHQRPEQTAASFIAHPFIEGARLYNSGDIMRWNADGELEFLGRRDHQVKIRGFRVELDEIQTLLESQPQVAMVRITTFASESGVRNIAAYLVPSEVTLVPAGSAQDNWLQSLQTACTEHLPTYMCPAAWVVLAQFMLTPNGKVDLRQLPPPQAMTQVAKVAPETPVEQFIAEIWQGVLGEIEIGRDDDFFALGGHSLAASSVIARLQEETGLTLPLKTLYELRQLRSFAQCVEELLMQAAETDE